MTDRELCIEYSIATYVVGGILCIGSIGGYIPQYVTLIKAKSAKGMSEWSMFFLCLSMCLLSVNSLILNWWRLSCFTGCNRSLSRGFCFLNLLSTFQIVISWVMATGIYILFIRFKCKCISKKSPEQQEPPHYETASLIETEEGIEYDELNENFELREIRLPPRNNSFIRRTYEQATNYIPEVVRDWVLFSVYVILGICVALLAVIEDLKYDHTESKNFFIVFAYVLGIFSAILSSLMWIPQILSLISTKNGTGLSVWMFLVQAPGSLVVVLFQAILYKQSVTTWLAYLINSIEQFVVAGLLIWIWCRDRN